MINRSLRLMYVASAVIASLATAKPQAPTSRPATQPSADVEDDVFEAVFRYQFEHNLSAQKQNAAVYYLSLQVRANHGPDAPFMKRFAGHKPPVRKVSERKAPGAAPGLIFNIESIGWSGGKAEVQGGYYEGPLSAAGSAYTVEKVHGKWKVTAEKPGWIA